MIGEKTIKNKISENEIEIRIAEMNELKQILTILDKATIWLYEIGIMNQWTPGEVFKYDEYYENAIEWKHWYVALNKNKIVGTYLLGGQIKIYGVKRMRIQAMFII